MELYQIVAKYLTQDQFRLPEEVSFFGLKEKANEEKLLQKEYNTDKPLKEVMNNLDGYYVSGYYLYFVKDLMHYVEACHNDNKTK